MLMPGRNFPDLLPHHSILQTKTSQPVVQGNRQPGYSWVHLPPGHSPFYISGQPRERAWLQLPACYTSGGLSLRAPGLWGPTRHPILYLWAVFRSTSPSLSLLLLSSLLRKFSF